MDGRTVALLFGLMSFTFVLLTVWLSARSKPHDVQKKRLQVLDKALGHQDLDPATKAEILRVLADEQRATGGARVPEGASWWGQLWFGAGWVLFVVGGCMLGAGAADLVADVSTKTYLPMTITGFAMLTLPMALRELMARRDRLSVPER